MRESISGTTSHVRASERAMRLKVRVIKSYHHSTKLYRKNITPLLSLALLLVLRTHDIFWYSLYYGDTYILYSTVPDIYGGKLTESEGVAQRRGLFTSSINP